ncbi:MAG: hypothetical protein ACRC6O_01720 [Flavobacterium sp.]
MNKKTIVLIFVAFIISFGTTFFIIKSNDHKECLMSTKKVKGDNGIWVTTEEHICKEKYSF